MPIAAWPMCSVGITWIRGKGSGLLTIGSHPGSGVPSIARHHH